MVTEIDLATSLVSEDSWVILSTLVTTSSAGIAAEAAEAKARAEMAAVKRILMIEDCVRDLEEGSWFSEVVKRIEEA